MSKALVVDDNDVNRILAVRLLSKAGWTVAEAEDGERALDWLSGNDAALVLLDISMPSMSGEEVCRHIREERLGGAGIRVVAYTAHAMPEEQAKFLAGGFDSVLIKPVSRDKLADTLASLGLGAASA